MASEPPDLPAWLPEWLQQNQQIVDVPQVDPNGGEGSSATGDDAAAAIDPLAMIRALGEAAAAQASYDESLGEGNETEQGGNGQRIGADDHATAAAIAESHISLEQHQPTEIQTTEDWLAATTPEGQGETDDPQASVAGGQAPASHPHTMRVDPSSEHQSPSNQGKKNQPDSDEQAGPSRPRSRRSRAKSSASQQPPPIKRPPGRPVGSVSRNMPPTTATGPRRPPFAPRSAVPRTPPVWDAKIESAVKSLRRTVPSLKQAFAHESTTGVTIDARRILAISRAYVLSLQADRQRGRRLLAGMEELLLAHLGGEAALHAWHLHREALNAQETASPADAEQSVPTSSARDEPLLHGEAGPEDIGQLVEQFRRDNIGGEDVSAEAGPSRSSFSHNAVAGPSTQPYHASLDGGDATHNELHHDVHPDVISNFYDSITHAAANGAAASSSTGSSSPGEQPYYPYTHQAEHSAEQSLSPFGQPLPSFDPDQPAAPPVNGDSSYDSHLHSSHSDSHPPAPNHPQQIDFEPGVHDPGPFTSRSSPSRCPPIAPKSSPPPGPPSRTSPGSSGKVTESEAAERALTKQEIAKKKNREKQRRFRERQKIRVAALERQLADLEAAKGPAPRPDLPPHEDHHHHDHHPDHHNPPEDAHLHDQHYEHEHDPSVDALHGHHYEDHGHYDEGAEPHYLDPQLHHEELHHYSQQQEHGHEHDPHALGLESGGHQVEELLAMQMGEEHGG